MPNRICPRVEPAHLLVEPVTPLRPELVGSGSQSCNLVTRKYDELRFRNEFPHHGVDGGERLLVKRAGDARTRIAVEYELVSVAARQQRRNLLREDCFRGWFDHRPKLPQMLP